MDYEHDNPAALAKEMFWLAWEASRPFGAGMLQDRPDATHDAVWANVSGESATDYCLPQGGSREPRADYVFGRMMKMGLSIESDRLSWGEGALRPDYQSWCRKYPTYEALAEAANASICSSVK